MDAQAPIARDLLCPQCGYNLRGLVKYRCPECGSPFDPVKLTAGAIPWFHRQGLGRVSAFWRTVALVTFRPRTLCREFAQTAVYSDSQRFRSVVVVTVYAPLLVATISMYGFGAGTPLDGLFTFKTFDPWTVIAVHLAFALAAAVATGVPSYFFHPRRLPVEQQNRAVALSYYAGAPLAWIPVLFILDWILLPILPNMAFGVVTTVLLILPLLAWWRGLYLLAKEGMAGGPGDLLLTGIVLPITCLVSTALTYTGVYFTVWFLGLVYYSLSD
jgi:hypothetical protein